MYKSLNKERSAMDEYLTCSQGISSRRSFVSTVPRKFIVGVRYKGNPKVYQFRYESHTPELKSGDHVVVKSANGLDVAKVSHVIMLPDHEDFGSRATAWVIQKVDMRAHDSRIERQARRKKLEEDIKARQEQLMSDYIRDIMAQTDPQMAAMLKELRDLVGDCD